MKYRASWNYSSSLCVYYKTGPLSAGTLVDLQPVAADAFNRDSPGVLVPVTAPVVPAVALAAPVPTVDLASDDTVAERAEKPARNRQYRTGGIDR